MANKIQVSAENTLFRVGFVSKLFVATAVMQLVEQGKLSLNENVNNYLTDLQLEVNYPKTVKMVNLLTHTSGFNEAKLRNFAHNEHKINFFMKDIKVSAAKNGKLMIGSERFIEIEHKLFQSTSNNQKIAFQEDVNGNIKYMFRGVNTFAKLSWYDTSRFHKYLLGFCIFIFSSAFLFWLAELIIRPMQKPFTSNPILSHTNLLAGGLSLLNIIFVVFMFFLMAQVNSYEIFPVLIFHNIICGFLYPF